MSFFLSILGLLPWWSWVAIVLGIAALSAFNLWPVFFKLVGSVPWEVWAVIGAGVGFMLWLDQHDQLVTQRAKASAVAERDKYWRGREEASNAAYAKQLLDLQRYIDGMRAETQKHADEAKAELDRAKIDLAHARDELKARRSRNVTDKAVAMCTLTSGVIVQFNEGAAAANTLGVQQRAGPDRAAAAAGPIAADSPSGVPLNTYTDAVQDTQLALGECRTQVTGWQKYHDTVIEPWTTSTLQAFESCIPKGVPQ